MSKVSIILPCYNTAQYLEECMESVINQTLKDIEIICVDDGSTDNTGKMLDDYASKDNRIKVIHKTNSGYGHSMNVGLDNATGEYIGIVEPDDYVALDMFETLYNKAIETDVDFIKADFHRFTGEKENIQLKYEQLDKTGEYYNQIINLQEDVKPFKFIMNTWSGIYKRSFIEKYHIRHNETPGASFQDNGFWFQTFTLADTAYFMDKPFYMNRRDNPNSSVKNKEKVYAMTNEYKFIYKFLNTHPEQKEKVLGMYHYRKFHNYMFNMNRIDIKFKEEFLNTFHEEYLKAYKDNELNLELFTEHEKYRLLLVINNPRKFYRKYVKRSSVLHKIFSVKNKIEQGKVHKVYTILGIKIKFRNKKRELLLNK